MRLRHRRNVLHKAQPKREGWARHGMDHPLGRRRGCIWMTSVSQKTGIEPRAIGYKRRPSSKWRAFNITGLRPWPLPVRRPRLSNRIFTVLDDAVVSETAPLLNASWSRDQPTAHRVAAALHRVELSAQTLRLELRTEAVDALAIDVLPPSRDVERLDDLVCVQCPVTLARPRGASALIRSGSNQSPRADKSLVRAVAMAHSWVARLESGEPKSIAALAKAEKICVLHTAKLLPLAFLAPDLVELILAGRQPTVMTLTSLLEEPLPMDWSGQRARFAALARI